MKKLVISALAFGAMTSVALAEEALTQTSGQPMQLSLAQLDNVTAGGKWRKKGDINVNVVAFKIEQENEAEVEQESEVEKVDLRGQCKNCTVFLDASNNAYVDQENEVEVKFDQEID
jgi:hypothetical protein